MNQDTLNMDQFNPKKAELITLADEAKKALSVEIVDKKTYEQVHQAQMILRDARVNIEKTGKTMREDAVAYQKKVIEVEKDLIAVISPVEEELKAKKKVYDDEQERIKEEEARKAEEALNNRVQELAKYGYTHSDMFDLKTKTDEEFQTLLSEKKTAWEESERIRIEEEEKKNRKNTRIQNLFSIGMFFNGVVYTSSEVPSIALDEKFIENGSEEEFNLSFDNFKSMIETARENIKKAREAQEAKDAELKAREDEINRKEAEQKRKADEEKRQEELKKAQEEAAEKARKETEDRLKKEKEDADRKKKEEEEAEMARKEEEERKLERGRKYQEFLTQIGYKKEEEHLWSIGDTEEGRVFYKRVGVFPKK